MSLEGKIALVTGASRGIGQAIALGLAKQGAAVIGTATSQGGADAISAYFEKAGYKGSYGLVLNVCEQDSIDNALTTIKDESGTPSILINNAAITQDNIMLRMKDEQWNSVIDTNLNSIYRMSKSVLKGMVKARWGRIVSVGSVVGLSGNLGQANYAAAKAGLIGFSKSLAQEIATRGITVNVVAPGFIETDMTNAIPEAHRELILNKVPMSRLGQVEDIAGVVEFLTSDAASYITGETINVNGGMYMA